MSIRPQLSIDVNYETSSIESSTSSTSLSIISEQGQKIAIPIAPGFKQYHRNKLQRLRTLQKSRNAYTSYVKHGGKLEDVFSCQNRQQVGKDAEEHERVDQINFRRSQTSRQRERL